MNRRLQERDAELMTEKAQFDLGLQVIHGHDHEVTVGERGQVQGLSLSHVVEDPCSGADILENFCQVWGLRLVDVPGIAVMRDQAFPFQALGIHEHDLGNLQPGQMKADRPAYRAAAGNQDFQGGEPSGGIL
jgi:hypothetical protein